MKKISLWASCHKWPSRIIIVISFISLSFLAIITGTLLKSLEVSIPIFFLVLFVVTYFVAFVIYPSKLLKRKAAAKFYFFQKRCDIILAGSTYLMIIFMANHPKQLFQYDQALNAAVSTNTSSPEDSVLKTYKSITEFTKSMKDQNGNPLKWKEKRKLLKDQVKGIKKANDMSNGAKITLITLSAIVALGLLYVVGALSCNISCSGSEGAAIAVAIGGAGLVIFLLIITIRAILGKKRKRKLADIQPASN